MSKMTNEELLSIMKELHKPINEPTPLPAIKHTALIYGYTQREISEVITILESMNEEITDKTVFQSCRTMIGMPNSNPVYNKTDDLILEAGKKVISTYFNFIKRIQQ